MSDSAHSKQPLDAPIAEMERRWKSSGIPGLYEGGNGPVSRERARNIRALLYPKPPLPTGRIERHQISGPNGPIDVRTVWPVQGAAQGTLVYFHGGGWVVGDVDSHEAHCIRLANRAQLAVLNVDYRLAPEHPFPQGAQDCIAALDWAHAHLDALGGVGKPLAVGGDSAGGNFAAVAALHAREAGIPLAAQLLIYAATDLGRIGDAEIRQAYFGDQAQTLALDWRASPAKAASLAGLAPAIMGVGPHDFLYADNLAYAALLRAAGVPLLWREYPTLNHGFFSYTAISAVCAAAADQLCDDLAGLMRG